MSNKQKAKEFSKTQTRLKNKLKLINWQLDNVLQDCWLKNSTDMIELQIERLKLLDKLKYLRPAKLDDIAYRKEVLKNFPYWAVQHIPEEFRLLFHATSLANTERILSSGKITSGKDRWTIRTSGDGTGEISISTKDSLFISLAGHSDLVAQEYFLPAGCLFVLQTDKQTYLSAQKNFHIPNVYLRKNPEQLYAVITTPENLSHVKWWMQQNYFSPDKVFDFNSFKNKIEEDTLTFFLIKNCQQTHLK